MEKFYLDEIYDDFLSSISDYAILEAIEENESSVEEDLFTYFKKARRKFYKCKQPLNIKEDENGKYFGYDDSEKGEVLVNPTGFEIDVLVQLMIVEYMKQNTFSTDVLKQSLSDKDFKIYSQANQLREINLLYRLVQKESRQKITEYTYLGMTDNDTK